MSTKDPASFEHDLDALELVERATVRFVSEAIYLQLRESAEQFKAAGMGDSFADGVQPLSNDPIRGLKVTDRYDYLAEDLTRLAMDTVGLSRVPDARIFGAIDYKAPRYVFLPDFAVKQALLIDSKAEKDARTTARLQITQTSLQVRQVVQNSAIARDGLVDKVWESSSHRYLTTTILVKYCYSIEPKRELREVVVAAVPHGFLQEIYNPTATDSIWRVGPSAPTRDEKFRTRLHFDSLAAKARWRVQRLFPGLPWEFATDNGMSNL